VRKPTGPDSQVHRFSHCNGIISGSNSGVHKDTVDAKLHRQRSVRCSSDTGIHDKRNLTDLLAKYPQVREILNARPVAPQAA
jgi:hypothetical protein